MKKLFSVKWSNGMVHLSLFVLRVGLGLMMLTHGISKLMNFSTLYNHFGDPLHVGTHISLLLVIFAELICAALLIIGLLSRPAAFVIFAEMCVILLLVMDHAPFGKQELAWFYAIVSFTILLCGPGKLSVDGMIS